MAYIVEADLVAEFGQAEITQLSTRDATAVASAITWAESLVDGYLNTASLSVPTVTPSDLKGVICDAVRWRLYDDALTDVVTLRFGQAMEWLRGIAAGRIVPSWSAPATGGSGGIAYTEPVATFTVMPE